MKYSFHHDGHNLISVPQNTIQEAWDAFLDEFGGRYEPDDCKLLRLEDVPFTYEVIKKWTVG